MKTGFLKWCPDQELNLDQRFRKDSKILLTGGSPPEIEVPPNRFVIGPSLGCRQFSLLKFESFPDENSFHGSLPYYPQKRETLKDFL